MTILVMWRTLWSGYQEGLPAINHFYVLSCQMIIKQRLIKTHVLPVPSPPLDLRANY